MFVGQGEPKPNSDHNCTAAGPACVSERVSACVTAIRKMELKLGLNQKLGPQLVPKMGLSLGLKLGLKVKLGLGLNKG